MPQRFLKLFPSSSLVAAAAISLLPMTAAAQSQAIDSVGEIQVEILDYPGNKSETIYHFVDKSKKRYRLNLPSGKKLDPGARVRVKGSHKDGVIDGSQTQIIDAAAGGTPSTLQAFATASATAVSGARTALAVIVDFTDANVSCDVASVNSVIFANPGTKSANDYFDKVSRKQLGFTGETIRVQVPRAMGASCSYYTWADAAGDQASQLRDLAAYNHIIYVLPESIPCTWSGMGQIRNRRSWVKRCSAGATFSHELGHNLGLYHASHNDGTEYGDSSDVLGSAWRELNAPHSIQMGWLPDAKVLTVNQGGRYTISHLTSDPLMSAYPHVVKLQKRDSAESYYLSYRKASGLYDVYLSTTYKNKLSIHRHTGGYAKTYSYGGFAAGSSYTDSANGIVITPVSSTTDTFTFDVTVPECSPAAPTVTVAPTKLTGKSGSTLSYTATIKSNDGWTCLPQSFKLTSTRPSGSVAAYSGSPVALAPGQTTQVTAAISSQTGLAIKDYSWTLNVTNEAHTSFVGQASAVYGITSTAPSSPTGLTASVSARTVTLKWLAPARSSNAISKYYVYRNGTLIGTSVDADYTNSSAPAGTHSYTVKALDDKGNYSTASLAASVRVY